LSLPAIHVRPSLYIAWGLGIEIPENASARPLPQTMATRYIPITKPGFSRGYTVDCQTSPVLSAMANGRGLTSHIIKS